MNLLLKSVIAGGALAMACATHAAILFSQPYDGLGNLYASQNDTNSGGYGQFAQVWDDFTLSSASNLNGVAWTGGYYNPASPAAISQFFLGIYADAAGTPGALMAFGNFAGNAGENCGGGAICTYSVSFGNYLVGAGTYWVSLVPDIGYPPQWGWATSATGTNNAVQAFFGTTTSIGANMAFDIMGAPVPEPETYALMLAGLGGLALAARRRKQG